MFAAHTSIKTSLLLMYQLLAELWLVQQRHQCHIPAPVPSSLSPQDIPGTGCFPRGSRGEQ